MLTLCIQNPTVECHIRAGKLRLGCLIVLCLKRKVDSGFFPSLRHQMLQAPESSDSLFYEPQRFHQSISGLRPCMSTEWFGPPKFVVSLLPGFEVFS